MRTTKNGVGITAAICLLAGTSAFGQFSAYFSGYYAPNNWSEYTSGNSSYRKTASVDTQYAPGSLEIDGAVSSQRESHAPRLPVSIIDYSIVLQGTGLQPVAFNYVFYGASDGNDAAQFIYYNASGAQVAASLSAIIGVEQTYNGLALGGQTIDFRVISNNDNVPDQLIICTAVPEPSSLALLGCGAGALLWRLRRRSS